MTLGFDVYEDNELKGTYDLEGAISAIMMVFRTEVKVHGTDWTVITRDENPGAAWQLKPIVEKRLSDMLLSNITPCDAAQAIAATGARAAAARAWRDDCLRRRICFECEAPMWELMSHIPLCQRCAEE